MGDEVTAVEKIAPAVSRRGPRSNGGACKEQILEAATAQFGEHGYQTTTIRKIAEVAGVDAKLVHYYFGTKENLFSTAIAETFRSRGLPNLLAERSTSGEGSPGTRYLLAVLTALEDPRVGPAFIGLARGLGTHEESRRIFLRFVSEELIGRLAPQLDSDQAEARVSLAGSQLLGLVIGRYVLKVPPLAELSISQVASTAGPTLDRYILGDLDWNTESDRIA
ncbi:DNA-binding transcriptional regulator, AcrR family [Propionibacterium cyclohexanicum]|mgnify:CR=1 FL=1|uniref:DNA-binding transcriptional regulator, AcrR family n=1 Tax=Propionibacterium cyclohexanicum TaxID=64702 RepID=A0A1H9TQW0_9ACTN|nr:TetR family transcriptional regulator [Propionibacterium cyclohexanicum]SER99397.1 DNA-binding transcriptional regulator, AcrR family [Propionibacterium cyclohexanicum]